MLSKFDHAECALVEDFDYLVVIDCRLLSLFVLQGVFGVVEVVVHELGDFEHITHLLFDLKLIILAKTYLEILFILIVILIYGVKGWNLDEVWVILNLES